MTLARLVVLALAVCSTLAFAQKNTDFTTVADQALTANNHVTATSSEPWKIIPNQPENAANEPLNRLQIDQFKVLRSKTDSRTFLLGPESDAGILLSGVGGDLVTDTTCLKIRSYVVARDSKNSDSTHPVSYSTCQPASRYRLRTTEVHSGSVDR
jgi:hypothetical protein